MSHIEIKINTNNDAFYNENGEYDPSREVAEILRSLAESVGEGIPSFEQLTDINGSSVGTFKHEA